METTEVVLMNLFANIEIDLGTVRGEGGKN